MKKAMLAGLVIGLMAACNPRTDDAGDNNRGKMNNYNTDDIEKSNYTSDTNGNTLDTDTAIRVKPDDSAKQPPL